jgi:hypothetical protein
MPCPFADAVLDAGADRGCGLDPAEPLAASPAGSLQMATI